MTFRPRAESSAARQRSGVIIVYMGRIEVAATEALFAAPHTKALLEEVPRIDSRRRDFEPIVGEIPSLLDPPPGCHFHPRCPFATERCKREVPALKEVAPGHISACHLND